MRKAVLPGLLFAISLSFVTLYGQWAKSYGTEENGEEAYSIQQTRDGGYIVVGILYTDVQISYCVVMKLNAVGDIEWQKSYGGSGENTDCSVRQMDDGGYSVAGYVNYNRKGTSGEMIVFKLDRAGDIVWQKNYEGPEGEKAHSVQQTKSEVNVHSAQSRLGSFLWIRLGHKKIHCGWERKNRGFPYRGRHRNNRQDFGR